MYLLNSVLLGLSVLATSAIAQSVIERRFSPTGPHISDKWCGIHVIQYQKNELSGHEPNSSEYVLDVCIYDDAQNLLNPSRSSGNSRCWIVNALNGVANIVPAFRIFDNVYVTVGAVDDDSILFSYKDQNWGSNDLTHHSNFGAYDGGKREGNTGFTCHGLWKE